MSISKDLRFKMISFTVEQASSGKTTCCKCRSNILKSEIRIKFLEFYSFTYFHLECFKPSLNQFIYKSDLNIWLNDSDLQVFNQWFERWNSKFYNICEKAEATELQASLLKIHTTRRRVLLEVFKFMSLADLLILSKVSKEFYQVTWEPELWKNFLLRDFKFSHSDENFKAKYVELCRKSCVECFQVPCEENYFMCPLIGKIICKDCLKKEKFDLLTQNEIQRMVFENVSELNLSYVNTKFGRKATYRYLVFTEVLKLRQEKKESILKLIESDPDISFCKFVECIDTRDMDIVTRLQRGKVFIKPNYKNIKNSRKHKKIFNIIRLGKQFDIRKFREFCMKCRISGNL